jgi:hypothetical protein
MAAHHVYWIEETRWVARRSAAGSGVAELELGQAVSSLLGTHEPSIVGVGVLEVE